MYLLKFCVETLSGIHNEDCFDCFMAGVPSPWAVARCCVTAHSESGRGSGAQACVCETAFVKAVRARTKASLLTRCHRCFRARKVGHHCFMGVKGTAMLWR